MKRPMRAVGSVLKSTAHYDGQMGCLLRRANKGPIAALGKSDEIQCVSWLKMFELNFSHMNV